MSKATLLLQSGYLLFRRSKKPSVVINYRRSLRPAENCQVDEFHIICFEKAILGGAYRSRGSHAVRHIVRYINHKFVRRLSGKHFW